MVDGKKGWVKEGVGQGKEQSYLSDLPKPETVHRLCKFRPVGTKSRAHPLSWGLSRASKRPLAPVEKGAAALRPSGGSFKPCGKSKRPFRS